MGKGRFVNQKLGKNISHKSRLLKSQLAVRPQRATGSPSSTPPLPKKGTSREGI